MLRRLLLGIAAAAATCTGAALAQDGSEQFAPVPEPPEIPDRVRSGEVLEPEVRIIRREDATITEYVVNGRVRAIKVEPKNAPAYYLADADGDGRLETRERLGANFLIPQWVLFSW